MTRTPDPNCPICTVGSTFGIPGCLVLDFMQVSAAQKRWQWATLGPGANDCPCIQDYPGEDAQGIEARSDTTGTGVAEGESPVASAMRPDSVTIQEAIKP